MTVYRNYVADALQVMAENTQRFAGGRKMTKRYADLIKPQKQQQKVENRTGEEIAGNIVSELSKLRK